MRRGGLAVWLALGWTAGAAGGCSGRSVVIGGDPNDGGTVSGGAFGGDTAATGGAFPTGGTYSNGGAFPTGGDGTTGGAFPSGGSPATGGVSGSVTGGASTFGGTAGSANGGTSPFGGSAATADGGDDGVANPYPRVAWENGQGYRSSCPMVGVAWGFTCWAYDTETRSCSPDGDPYCNACACLVPCETAQECPPGTTGAAADCIASATTTKSCFLVCDQTMECPAGMGCMRHPGTDRYVCMWVSEDPGVPD